MKINIRVKYIFYPSTFSEDWNGSLLTILNQFSFLSLKMRKFNHLNHFF